MNKIALVGNPNSGKTTLFNRLTGSNQYVGNRAGVTVEKKIGTTKDGNFSVIDLPGVYSLSPYSPEEKVTRDFLLNESPDGIINIIDGTNLERNLYLTLQLAWLGVPIVAAVNMIDEAEKLGLKIDCDRLSAQLGFSVIPISARKGTNISLLLAELKRTVSERKIPSAPAYRGLTEKLIREIRNELPKGIKFPDFFAEKLVEGDRDFLPKLKLPERNSRKINELLDSAKAYDTAVLVAEERYRLIEKAVEYSVKKPPEKASLSEKIDRIATHRILAFPIFLAVMLAVFSVTFGAVGNFFSELISDLIFRFVSPSVSGILSAFHASPTVYKLVLEAVVGGVGNVLKFLPQIALLFFCLSVLEDSGYMARGAFITDRFLRKIGLSGKSFIPMIMGFGCTTPAVMATRVQENAGRKRLTILLLPFMSCGAKITVYTLFADAFFTKHAELAVFSMYFLGIICAVAVGLFLKNPVVGTGRSEFVMELPPYRLPDWYSVGRTTFERCKAFLIKAGTVIFVMNIAVWILQNFSPAFLPVENSADSIFGKIGTLIAPIFAPLGFGEWEAGVSLLSGFAAKEGIVSSLCVLYQSTSFELGDALKQHFSPLSAYSYMAFCLLYPPCISAFTAMKKELGGWKFPILSLIIQLFTAYFVSLFIYQVGSLMLRII